MQLTKRQRQTILKKIDDMFMGLKARLLGRFFTGPRIYFQVVKDSDPMETLEGLYHYTMMHSHGPGSKINQDNIEDLSEITGNYIDAFKLKIVNKIMSEVAQSENANDAIAKIKENVEKADDYISKLVSTETKTVQAYAEKEGISQVASSIGVKDPVVAKLGVWDDKTCSSCKKLWHSQGNAKVPKVYKMSELIEGYNSDHKNPKPTVGPTHPNCRHTMTLIPPDFGFDKNGQIVFKSLGYDEYESQKN